MAPARAEAIDVEEARREIAGGAAVAVDVRDDAEWNEGHVPGAIHLPNADPEAGTKKIESGARLVVFASSAGEAKEAASKLSDDGYEAVAVDGSMKDWMSENFQVQPSTDPDEDTELGLS